MATEKKIEMVSEIANRIENSQGIYFTKYTGMSVSEATMLRRDFRDNGVTYTVSKNTLVRLAANSAGYGNQFDRFLKGQIGIAYSEVDPVSPARVIKKFKKENNSTIEVVGLVFEGEVYEAEKFAELASLPSREELMGKLLGGISQPMGNLVATLNGAMGKVVGLLNSLKETKS